MSANIEVLVTINLSDGLVEKLKQVSPQLKLSVHPARRADEIPAEVWKRTEVLYTFNLLPEPDKVPNLRWVQFHSAGIDALLSSPLFQRTDILFTTLSGAAAPQMAEYVLMMMLALGHKMPQLHQHQARADWPRERWEQFLPFELRGSTVGIVGYGSIGRELARILQPFGMNILAAKRDAMHPADTGYVHEGLGDPEGVYFNRLYPIEALNSMLRQCDFVVVTVPLTEKTHKLIGEEQFKAMKPGSYLVDVSRGDVVDEKALLSALQENRIAGAALDVFVEEPLPPSSPFWKLPNVIISPHIAGISPMYKDRAVDLFATNLERYLNGSSLFNRFEPERGY